MKDGPVASALGASVLGASALGPSVELLHHFCRMQLPAIAFSLEASGRHLQRTYALYASKAGGAASWNAYLESLYPLDWFLACACLEREPHAWETLFAARAGRSDCLLLDALRARA